MSGWHPSDRSTLSQRKITAVRAGNNITQPGTLGNYFNSTGTSSRTIAQAHFRALRCYRHYCRMVPWIIKIYSMNESFTEAEAKKNLARHWRHANKVRNPAVVDAMVSSWYERMQNIKQLDIWGGQVYDLLGPQSKEQYIKTEGYSFYDDAKYKGKSEFVKDFYKGGRKAMY
ncbi:unnamed protein product [Moneuplotes crassus]|uniref:Uncharacterized protein n=1 Tax=Euplotes crassus TaxID=5936 RepID=A0AAD1Y0I6_EUPCR|nr:unnamed protein product [Moneuplotes crassus]